MNKRILPMIAVGLMRVPAVQAASVLIDFGRIDNQTSGSPVYNNLAIGTSTGAALSLTTTFQNANIAVSGGSYSSTSASLVDTTGATTGWSIAMLGKSQSVGGGGQIGTAGSGGDYTGTLGINTSSLFAGSATRDGLFVNNSGILQVTISGLDITKSYNLSAFAGRDGTSTSDGGFWTLVSGTALSSEVFLNGSATPASFTGSTLIDSYGLNQGDLITWSGVTPGAGGVITFNVATQNLQSNAIASLNSLSIVQIPEPSAAVLGGLGCALLLRRRRQG